MIPLRQDHTENPQHRNHLFLTKRTAHEDNRKTSNQIQAGAFRPLCHSSSSGDPSSRHSRRADPYAARGRPGSAGKCQISADCTSGSFYPMLCRRHSLSRCLRKRRRHRGGLEPGYHGQPGARRFLGASNGRRRIPGLSLPLSGGGFLGAVLSGSSGCSASPWEPAYSASCM